MADDDEQLCAHEVRGCMALDHGWFSVGIGGIGGGGPAANKRVCVGCLETDLDEEQLMEMPPGNLMARIFQARKTGWTVLTPKEFSAVDAAAFIGEDAARFLPMVSTVAANAASDDVHIRFSLDRDLHDGAPWPYGSKGEIKAAWSQRSGKLSSTKYSNVYTLAYLGGMASYVRTHQALPHAQKLSELKPFLNAAFLLAQKEVWAMTETERAAKFLEYGDSPDALARTNLLGTDELADKALREIRKKLNAAAAAGTSDDPINAEEDADDDGGEEEGEDDDVASTPSQRGAPAASPATAGAKGKGKARAAKQQKQTKARRAAREGKQHFVSIATELLAYLDLQLRISPGVASSENPEDAVKNQAAKRREESRKRAEATMEELAEKKRKREEAEQRVKDQEERAKQHVTDTKLYRDHMKENDDKKLTTLQNATAALEAISKALKPKVVDDLVAARLPPLAQWLKEKQIKIKLPGYDLASLLNLVVGDTKLKEFREELNLEPGPSAALLFRELQALHASVFPDGS